MMTTKDWLSRATELETQINQLLLDRRKAWERCTSLTTRADADKVSGTRDPHQFESIMAYEHLIDDKVDELQEARREIADAIHKVNDSALRDLLLCRYIHGLRWDEIAERIGRTPSMTRIKLHARAISAIEPIVTTIWCAKC